MARGGRKPQPTALRILRGNPGQRRLPAAEPKAVPLESDAVPGELAEDDVAIREWQRITPGLIATGHIASTDRLGLIVYCQRWSQYLTLEQAARDDPEAWRKTNLAHKACELLLRTMAELGLTPTSRTRVHALKAGAPVSKWGTGA